MPVIAKKASQTKFTGYNIDYKVKPKTTGGYTGAKSRPTANRYLGRLY